MCVFSVCIYLLREQHCQTTASVLHIFIIAVWYIKESVGLLKNLPVNVDDDIVLAD